MTVPAGYWITATDVSDALGSDAPAPDDTAGQARLDDSAAISSELLYALSGRQFPGLIAVVDARPTSKPEQVTDYIWATRMSMYTWGLGYSPDWLWGMCFGSGHSSCQRPVMIGLGRSPIVSIESVQIDGTILDPSEYRVDDAKWLVRQDCAGWPTCQRLDLPLSDSCTFGVSFTFGQAPPKSGEVAATTLAEQIYRANTPALVSSCKLPARVSSITRQGVSIAVLDPMTFIKDGFTGIYGIDLFIKAFNPGKWVRKPMVFSPDMVNIARRQTWP